MTESANEIRRYLDQPLEGLLDELALYREEATGGPLRGPSDAWERLVPALRRRVCDQWNWCERRQDARLEENVALATLLRRSIATREGFPRAVAQGNLDEALAVPGGGGAELQFGSPGRPRRQSPRAGSHL